MTKEELSNLHETNRRSTELTALLSAQFPNHRTVTNLFDVRGFAADLGYAAQTLYTAVAQRKELSPTVARRIVQASITSDGLGRLYYSDLLPFIFHDWDLNGAWDDEMDDLLA